MDNKANVTSEVTALLRSWEDGHGQSGYDPVPTLTK